jgi:hypothetical protein
MLGEREHRVNRPDHQMFDEIRIVTKPRYKQSDLSGDEWRIHAETQFWCKGRLMKIAECSNVHYAVTMLGGEYVRKCDEGRQDIKYEQKYCDQEGCLEPHNNEKRFLKARYTRTEGLRHSEHSGDYRMFCDRHSRRGDCGLDDADSNYQSDRQSDS